MISRTTFTLFLFYLLLGGCAQVTHKGNNPTSNEKLMTSQVVWETPTSLPFRYQLPRLNQFTAPSPLDSVNAEFIQRKRAESFLATLEKEVPQRIASFLSTNGVPAGQSSTITIRPVAVEGNSTGPTVSLEVTVEYRDKTQTPWTATVRSWASALMTNRTSTEMIVTDIEDKLVRAGFVSRR